jgi:hypothetical protein
MRATALLVSLALAPGISCRPVPASLADTPEAARQHVNELATAAARRFGPSTQDPALAALRPKLERAVLVPSRVFDDASAWTARTRRARASGRSSGATAACASTWPSTTAASPRSQGRPAASPTGCALASS